MQQLGGVVAATRGCGSSQKGCGFRQTLKISVQNVEARSSQLKIQGMDGIFRRSKIYGSLEMVVVPRLILCAVIT